MVTTTYERPEACAAAVCSALAQEPSPDEVLVCDDGSSAGTVERLRVIEAGDPRVRLLPATHNTGSPGAGRNRGIRAARGEWVAFLDDDDVWLPGKLARQLERASSEDVEVVATNARRSAGAPYFAGAAAEHRPARDELLRDNPVIVSSALVRADVLRRTGGFLEPRWARGVADYAMWLALADAGARFAILGDILVGYEDGDPMRMSGAPVRQEAAVARMFWLRWRARPGDRLALRWALAKTAAAARVSVTRLRHPGDR